jgi:hypothetical protein
MSTPTRYGLRARPRGDARGGGDGAVEALLFVGLKKALSKREKPEFWDQTEAYLAVRWEGGGGASGRRPNLRRAAAAVRAALRSMRARRAAVDGPGTTPPGPSIPAGTPS